MHRERNNHSDKLPVVSVKLDDHNIFVSHSKSYVNVQLEPLFSLPTQNAHAQGLHYAFTLQFHVLVSIFLVGTPRKLFYGPLLAFISKVPPADCLDPLLSNQ